MSWYDEHLDTPPAEGQRNRQEDARGLPHRARDDDCYYDDEDCDNYFVSTDFVGSDGNSKVGERAYARSDGDVDDGARLGVDGSHDWGSDETDVGRRGAAHMDAVVLRSLEQAISKYSATRQRPSTAHIDTLERSAMMKTRMFGHQNSATRKAFRDTIVACNSLAMFSLGRSDPARCRDLLKRALALASDTNITGEDRGGGTLGRDSADGDPALQVLTLNNTACLHRRLGEPKRALRCLRRAAQVGRQSSGSEHLEVTHLNACAVLSELGRHEEALEHARSAVFYGQEREEVGSQRGGWEGGGERLGGAGSRRARLATLAVSYYNLAVELEYTRRYQACLRWYNEAVKLACDPDVRNDGLIQTFQRSYAGARKKHAPHLLRRSGVEKGPVARDGSSNRFPVPDADTTAPTGSYGSASNNNDARISEADGGRLRRVEWPDFGRVKRQRAGDERRSKTSDRKSRNVTNKSGTEATAASAAASFNGDARDASPQQRWSSGQAERVAIQAARRRPAERGKCVGEERSRPARGGGGGGGGGGDGSGDEGGGGGGGDGISGRKRPEPQRKRPASAEISRDRHLEGRAYRQDGPRIPAISEAARLSMEPTWQPLRGVSREEASVDNNKLKSGVAVADDRLRRRAPHSRRSMSAHSRLGEGNRTRGSTAPTIGRDGEGGGDGRNARVSRPRWSTAGVLRESASQPMPSIVCGDAVGGQGSGRSRNSVLNDAREMSPELEVEQTGGRCGVKATAAGRPRPDEDRAVAASHTSGGRRIRFASSASASDIHRRTRTSSTELGARIESDSPTTPLHRAGRAAAERQAENSRGVDNGAFSSARVSTNPQKVTDFSEERISLRESTFDNGRDGKLYLNPWPGEPPCGLGSLGSEASDFLVDNGRDGKFYLDLETDTQRCRLTNLDSDHNRFREEQGKGADRTYNVESARVMEEVAVDEARVELAKEHKDHKCSVGRSAQQCAEAARATHKAAVVAAWRGRSARNHVDTERKRVLLDAAETEEARRESRRAPLEIISGLATIDDHGSGAKGVGDLEERCAQLSAAPPAEGLEADSSDTKVKTECTLGRTAADRRTLAASAIRVWLARACLARRLQRRRARELHLRWEPEIHRIAATRIQSVARGAACRRKLQRMGRAALEIQRAVQGWRVRSAAKALALKTCVKSGDDTLLSTTRPNGHRAACEKIQRLFREYQGRQQSIKKRQIAWEIVAVDKGPIARSTASRAVVVEAAHARLRSAENAEMLQDKFRCFVDACLESLVHLEEAMVHLGAAGVIQSCWHRHRSKRLLRHAPQQQTPRKSPLPAAAAEVSTEHAVSSSSSNSFDPPPTFSRLVTMQGADDSTATTASSKASSAEQNPVHSQVPNLWRGAQADASIYALWGAFTSLLTATATRRAVRRTIATALLGPAAATFASFNRDRRAAAAVAVAAVPYPFSASPPTIESSCDPEKIGCARTFKRKIGAASRRMEGVVRARTASLSIVRGTATSFVGDAGFVGDGGGDGGGIVGGGGCANDSAAPVEAQGGVEEVVQATAWSLVLQAVEECWSLLSSRNSSALVGLEDERGTETLTEILSGTLQDLVNDLSEIIFPPHSNLQRPPEALVRTLSSSAAASLLFHPDFADAFSPHEDAGVFSEEWRDDESGDYSRLVAEVCSCLLVPHASQTNAGEELSSENETNDQHETARNEELLSHADKGSSPAAPLRVLSPPACYPRAKERSQLLLAVAQLIDDTSEELACEMLVEPALPAHKNHRLQGKCIPVVDSGCLRDSRDPPSPSSSGWRYHDALRRMTDGLWELASGVSMPIDAMTEEDRAAFLSIEEAVRLVQEWLRRQWTRRRTRILRS